MDERLVAEYLTKLKDKTGLTYDAIGKKCNRSESTVKKLCLGDTEDPRVSTVYPVVYALGGSMDEMLNPNKSKDELKETSVMALKDSYEYQADLLKDTLGIEINNIRSHYEQHHEDLKENFEKRLTDKRELNDSLKEQIKDLKKANLIKNIIIGFFVCGVITLCVLELVHPEHGWLRF